MKMDKCDLCSYDEAVSWCHRVIQSKDKLLFDPRDFHSGVAKAAQKFGYAFESMDSLLRHIHLQHVKKRIYKIRANISNYIQKYCRDGKSIVALSKDANYPPYMMARVLVEHMHVNFSGSNKGKGGNKKYITDAMKDPKKVLSDGNIKTILRPEYLSSELIGPWVENTTLEEAQCIDSFSLLPIPLFEENRNFEKKKMTRIAREVIEAIEKDPLYGPRHDKQRRIIGLEHEIMLEQALHAMGIPFETETDLRIKGTSRTPDLLLSFPIGMKVPVAKSEPDNSSDSKNQYMWKTICWIDSKAMFGDVQTHQSETLRQAEAFVHRFGPGLIIYWFGHAPIERLSNGYGDISVSAWNVPECIMLPSKKFRKQGGQYPSFTH